MPFSKIIKRSQLGSKLEFVDPDREPTRAKEAGIKKYGTLHLQVGTRESNVDDVSEEKLTNALIKLVRDKMPDSLRDRRTRRKKLRLLRS